MLISISVRPFSKGSLKFNVIDTANGIDVSRFIEDTYDNEESIYKFMDELTHCNIHILEEFNRWIFTKAAWINHDWLDKKRLELMQWISK